MKVMKFGGSSLKSGEGMRRVCKIISSDEELKVVVVSALSGVTEELIQFMGELHKEDEIENIRRYQSSEEKPVADSG